MGQVEELPDDFDESLDLNKQTAQPKQPSAPVEPPAFPINEERLKEIEQNDPTAPPMPPSMAGVKTHTTEELWDMMNKTPLFMTDIDKAGDERASPIFCGKIVAADRLDHYRGSECVTRCDSGNAE